MGGCCASELGHPLTEFESGHVASLPRQFVVRLDGIGNEGLGLEVDIGDDVTASITKVLSDGAIPAWNQRNARELAVQAGDHIVEVNGIRGSAKEIIANIKGGAELSVVIGSCCVQDRAAVTRGPCQRSEANGHAGPPQPRLHPHRHDAAGLPGSGCWVRGEMERVSPGRRGAQK
ncbi:unnamed protein product [Prorocentrum cordatum]|uniref:PDZ domain-containing protein n=1 Tax=Prorocentrum cordatum TaxID=2364126 RepID=A0ABN9SCA9_9DINO|nr:unnamed protein product [Polarella glacialis]